MIGLETVEAQAAALAEKTGELVPRELQREGMGDDRLAAGAVDELDRFFQVEPEFGIEKGLPLPEVARESVRDGVGQAAVHQEGREMQARDHLAPGERGDVGQGDGDARLVHFPHDAFVSAGAVLADDDQPFLKGGAIAAQVQSQKVEFAVIEIDLELHAGHEAKVQRGGPRRGFGQSREHVVVGQGDGGKTARGGGLHERRRGQFPVGMGGMGV